MKAHHPKGGEVTLAAPDAFKLRWQLDPFGERFRFVVNDGQHDISMLLTANELRKLRDRANAALGEGREARKRLRAHRHEKA